MKTNRLLFVVWLFVLVIAFPKYLHGQLDTVGFPLDIGNKWFYRFVSASPPAAPYLIVMTIVDTTQDGTRVVRIGRTSNDSTGTQNWSVINGRFYVGSLLLYDASLRHDTTWEVNLYGVDRYTYQLRRVTLFGSNSRCQIFVQYHFDGISGFSSWGDDRVALGVGWYYDQHNGDAGEGYYYESSLIGLMKNGVLYGDTTLTSVDNSGVISPGAFEVRQNYPNPFNPQTTISFSIPRSTYTTLKIYNTLGQEIATLVSEDVRPGTYSKQWNATNVASGVYYYRLQAGDFVQTKKLLLLR